MVRRWILALLLVGCAARGQALPVPPPAADLPVVVDPTESPPSEPSAPPRVVIRFLERAARSAPWKPVRDEGS